MSGKDKLECDANAICAKYIQASSSRTTGGNKERLKSPDSCNTVVNPIKKNQ